MITLTPNKLHVIPYVDPNDPEFSFSVSWKFPLSTSKEMDELKARLDLSGSPSEQMDKILAECIQAQTGFIDEEGKPLDTSNSVHRAAIYDFIKPFAAYRLLVLTAYVGPRAKNLSTSATQPSTGSGDQKDAQNVSES